MEPGEQKPVRDRGPRPVDLRVPGRGRRVFRPAAVRPSRPAENTPGEKLPLHPRNSGQRPAGHLCQSRGGARFGGPASDRCCGPGGNRAQRAFRGHLSGKGDQPHGGRGRYAGCTGQRRGVTGTPPQLFRNCGTLPHPPAVRAARGLPEKRGHPLCSGGAGAVPFGQDGARCHRLFSLSGGGLGPSRAGRVPAAAVGLPARPGGTGFPCSGADGGGRVRPDDGRTSGTGRGWV